MRKAFTLIELLVVVLIIGILTAAVIPQYQKAVEKARATQAITLVKSLAQAAQEYYMANNEYATQFNQLSLSVSWTGNRKWWKDETEAKSNSEWTALLYNYHTNHAVVVARTDGPYKGAGFMLSLATPDSKDTYSMHTQAGKLNCVERANGNIIFTANPDSYCKGLFGGNKIFDNGNLRVYRISL